MSEQLAREEFGRVRPIGWRQRIAGELRHRILGIHMVIPTVEIVTNGLTVTGYRHVQECAFCTWRG